MKAPPIATSHDWRTVREFVAQVRLQAHEPVENNLDAPVFQDILTVVNRLGMELVGNMINHEKRLIGSNDIQRFWATVEYEEETKFEANYPHRGTFNVQTSEANHGI